MKMQLYNFDNDIFFEDEYVNVIEIENKPLFVQIVESLNDISNGLVSKEKIFFYQNDVEIELYNKIDVIFDIFNFDFSKRKTLNQLYMKIENVIKSDSNMARKFNDNINELITLVNPALNDFDIEFTRDDNFSIPDFLKFIKLNINLKEKTIVDKTLLIIDLESILSFNEIIIFIDLKKYVSDDELLEIYKYSKYKGVKILLVESVSDGVSKEYEKKLIIDQNFDEFLIKNGV
ncbi:MAG: type II-A CRISPR-associated protein Csn2 [Bacilli bacterium]|nr:type II-A CRISPR-associated protein Csn2 [Bacilli bacterium]MDD4411678.1 type II-A CRISPR-associated protein Csn2 [Bacilli bacterium]